MPNYHPFMYYAAEVMMGKHDPANKFPSIAAEVHRCQGDARVHPVGICEDCHTALGTITYGDGSTLQSCQSTVDRYHALYGRGHTWTWRVNE